jgi:hypothetical protein
VFAVSEKSGRTASYVVGVWRAFNTVEGNLQMGCVAHLNTQFESWPSALREKTPSIWAHLLPSQWQVLLDNVVVAVWQRPNS